MSMEEARANAAADLSERGFRKIAWAFLKVEQNTLFSVIGLSTTFIVDYWYFPLLKYLTPSLTFPHVVTYGYFMNIHKIASLCCLYRVLTLCGQLSRSNSRCHVLDDFNNGVNGAVWIGFFPPSKPN